MEAVMTAKVRKALRLREKKGDLQAHQAYCRLVGGMFPSELQELTRAVGEEYRWKIVVSKRA